MGEAHRWRWDRMLLLVAVLLGVVAMHSMVVPVPADMPGMVGPQAAALMPAHAAPVNAQRPPAPVPAHHAGMQHMCLAVLAGVLALGLLLAGALLARRVVHAVVAWAPARVVTVLPRPPPPMAERLAELCVLRN